MFVSSILSFQWTISKTESALNLKACRVNYNMIWPNNQPSYKSSFLLINTTKINFHKAWFVFSFCYKYRIWVAYGSEECGRIYLLVRESEKCTKPYQKHIKIRWRDAKISFKNFSLSPSKSSSCCLTLQLPWLTKTEFLLTISTQNQADK